MTRDEERRYEWALAVTVRSGFSGNLSYISKSGVFRYFREVTGLFSNPRCKGVFDSWATLLLRGPAVAAWF